MRGFYGCSGAWSVQAQTVPDERRCAQAFIENREDTIIPWIVDVRDIGRAHVLAAEVSFIAGRDFTSPVSTCTCSTLLVICARLMLC